MPTITLVLPALPARSYPIVAEAGALALLPSLIPADADGTVILHDAALVNVATRVAESVSARGVIAVESGEASKTLHETERVIGALLRMGATRKSVLLNVGGGMLTDLGGFVAAVFMRGARYIHVPTSLLCMTDAAIGGKSGVNLVESSQESEPMGAAPGRATGRTEGPAGAKTDGLPRVYKNVIGAVQQPLAVVCDIDLLGTLPDIPLREGVVEAIKMAAMLDAGTFAWFETALEDILARKGEALTRCVAEAVRMKAAVVGGDEREDGRRMLLNFGHTVGHAVEGHSRVAIPHGQAVSIGMCAEMALAGFVDAERVHSLMRRMGMPLAIPSDMARASLWDLMIRDKKTIGGEVCMAVPVRIGEGEIRPLTRETFLTRLLP